MDRETRDQYVLVIQAKDMVGQMGGLSGTTSVTVTLTDVNDNPPRFTHSKTDFYSATNWAHCLHLCVVKSYSALTLKAPALCFTWSFFARLNVCLKSQYPLEPLLEPLLKSLEFKKPVCIECSGRKRLRTEDNIISVFHQNCGSEVRRNQTEFSSVPFILSVMSPAC